MQQRFRSGAVVATVGGGLLFLGVLSLRTIPFHEPFWGLDFQNVFAFETCTAALREGMYAVSGEICGDAIGRPFVYPPAVFGVFAWVRWFAFSHALAIWDVLMIIITVGVGAAWLWLDRQSHAGWRTGALALFWLGLMAQFPFVFALERSNNDVIPLALWTVAGALFVQHRFAQSGGFAGLAIAFKVYPVVATGIVIIATVRERGPKLMLFATGTLVGAVLASAVWWQDTVHYIRFVLPEFAAQTPALTAFGHPIRSLDLPPVLTLAIGAALFGSWTIAAWRKLPESPLMIFAGSLAISTYFSSTSWDYNLITAYPLLLLVGARALDPERSDAWKTVALVSVFAIASGRGVAPPSVMITIQVAVLAWIAWLVILDDQSGHGNPSLPDPPPAAAHRAPPSVSER